MVIFCNFQKTMLLILVVVVVGRSVNNASDADSDAEINVKNTLVHKNRMRKSCNVAYEDVLVKNKSASAALFHTIWW